MSKRVILHVGCPKTGTSQVQHLLFRNRVALEWQGILYPVAQPLDRHDGQFLAALDLMSLPWGGLEREAVGGWDRLVQQSRDWFDPRAPRRALIAEERGDLLDLGFIPEAGPVADPHTVIISHEILARASRVQIDRALRALTMEGVEVHLVVSARDLVRQIPAEWQENIKHRAGLTYAEFLDQLRDETREGRFGSWFWAVQELPEILDRWGATLPPEHIHVVTVPPSGAPRPELMRRFAEAFGLEGLKLTTPEDRDNPSLGVPETALIRRINLRGIPAIEPAVYRPLVRELLAHQTLSHRTGSPRLVLPPDAQDWAHEVSSQWVEWMRERGVDVIGDLDDLLGADAAADWVDPDRPRQRDVADAGVDAIVALVLEVSRMRAEHEEFERRVVEAEHRAAMSQRGLKGKVYDVVAASGPGRRALRAYRAARGSNSRSA